LIDVEDLKHDPYLTAKDNPGSLRWLVSRKASMVRWAVVIGHGSFRAAYSTSVKSQKLQDGPANVVRGRKWRDRLNFLFQRSREWWVGCIIYFLSLLL
jgi:hypothetical protein